MLGAIMGGLGAVSSLFGGNNDKSETTQQSSAMLPSVSNAWNSYAPLLAKYLDPANGGANYFTPMGQTADENQAFGMMRQGFAPKSAADVSNSISMFMNPYNDYVINDINDQAQGNYSLLKQAVTDAGQFGSNRQVLGAGELERNRLNTIGNFQQGQFNNALDMAMNTMPALQMQDAQNLLGIGNFQRNLDTQTRQAPINALNQWSGLMGVLPQSGAATTSQTNQQNGSAGLGGMFGNIGSGLGSFGSLLSGLGSLIKKR